MVWQKVRNRWWPLVRHPARYGLLAATVAAVLSFAIPPSYVVGHYRGWLQFLRLDHQINDHNSVFFRSGVDAFHDTNPNGTVGGNNLPSVARSLTLRSASASRPRWAAFRPTCWRSFSKRRMF